MFVKRAELTHTHICGSDSKPLQVKVFKIEWTNGQYAVYTQTQDEKFVRAYGFDKQGLGSVIDMWTIIKILTSLHKH